MRVLTLLWIAAAFLRKEGGTELVGDTLDSFRKPTAGWMQAGEVSLDPAEPKKLAWKDGKGVVFNGKDGRTSNLFSAVELKDVELHV